MHANFFSGHGLRVVSSEQCNSQVLDRPGTTLNGLRGCMVGAVEYDWHPRLRRQAEAVVAAGGTVTVVALRTADQPAAQTVDGVRVERLPVAKYRGASVRAYLWLY